MEEAVLLEQKLKEDFIRLGISLVQQSSLEIYLNLIKLKDEATYHHCLRVALYGTKVAELLHLDPKALFYAGLLHDVGKALISRELLSEAGDFSDADYEKMKKHSLYGYYLLRGVHDFSAEVILRHHRHANGGYPKRLPKPRVCYQKATKELIDYYAKILAVIDFYDAARTRKNKKFKDGDVRTLLNKRLPEEVEMIYEKGIFTENDEADESKVGFPELY